jgi:hypothetical protein
LGHGDFLAEKRLSIALRTKLADVVAETIFRVTRFVKAPLLQFPDSRLRGGTLHGSDEHAPVALDAARTRHGARRSALARFNEAI